jgi:hypothetical protein
MPFQSQGKHPENPVSPIAGTPLGLCPVNLKLIFHLPKNRLSFGYSIRTKLDMLVWLDAECKDVGRAFSNQHSAKALSKRIDKDKANTWQKLTADS